MAVPVSQAWTVATYVLKQKLMGRKRAEIRTRCGRKCKKQVPRLRIAKARCFARDDRDFS